MTDKELLAYTIKNHATWAGEYATDSLGRGDTEHHRHEKYARHAEELADKTEKLFNEWKSNKGE